MIICDGNKCTGCAACMNICPKDCITMDFNERFELVPKIDEQKCIKCGACQRICPSNNEVEQHLPMQCYACYAPEERSTSSSGGIAAELAKQFVQEGGCVCGAVYENGTVHHSIIDDEKDLPKLKGSKYVQSYINDCHKRIKEEVKRRKVLFVGTPCQVAAVRKVVGDDKNLYCVDLICHGGTSHKYLDEIISFEKAGELSFRKNGDYAVRVDDQVVKYSSEYISAFMCCMSCRECCYSCIYAKNTRIGDITLGDFWGIKNFPEASKGVSVLLANTEKGKELFDSIKGGLYYEERKLEEALPENPQLSRPSIPHKHREIFLKAVGKVGFVKAVHKSMKKEMFKQRIKKIVYSNRMLCKLYEAIR